jgi:hypothetical protein
MLEKPPAPTDEMFKRDEEERRQQERIDKAVEEEREKWEARLAKEKENRRLVVHLVVLVAGLLGGGYIVYAINKHFHGVPGDVVFTALGDGIGPFIGAFLYLWGVTSFGLKLGLLVNGKPAPWLMPSAYVVFFGLWAALVYASFSRWF